MRITEIVHELFYLREEILILGALSKVFGAIFNPRYESEIIHRRIGYTPR